VKPRPTLARPVAVLVSGALVVFSATIAPALEKVAVRAPEERTESWTSLRSTNTVAYYNFCTGWIWCWSGWEPGDRLGVTFCVHPWGGCMAGVLNVTWMYACTGCPTGYGYTGTQSLWDADADWCPEAELWSQPLLPGDGWNGLAWGVYAPSTFTLMYTVGPGTGSPLALAFERASAGPTGPPACGTCYPSTRPTHSFHFGTESTPYCPGLRFGDGACDVELVWDASGGIVMAEDPVAVDEPLEPATWGNIKALYR
jgi:hypothetical protein